MITQSEVTKLVVDKIQEQDFFVSEISVNEKNKSILVEIDAMEGVSIDYCVEMSRYLVENLSPVIEEYDLEVSSASISQPFKVRQQYLKFQGEEVEVLIVGGEKLKGVLGESDDEKFALDVVKKVKPEGAKRKIEVTETLLFKYNEVKSVKNIIKF